MLFYIDTDIVLEQRFHVIDQLVYAFSDIPAGDMPGFYPVSSAYLRYEPSRYS